MGERAEIIDGRHIKQHLTSMWDAMHLCMRNGKYNEFTRGHQSLEDDFPSGRP